MPMESALHLAKKPPAAVFLRMPQLIEHGACLPYAQQRRCAKQNARRFEARLLVADDKL